MEKKINMGEVKKEVKKEIVKRKDYKELINFLVENKNLENKEVIRERYEKRFNLKFSNLERLLKRSLRVESKKNLFENLEKEKLSIGEYLILVKKFKIMSKERKDNILINCEKIIN